jgi:hypothetical protein
MRHHMAAAMPPLDHRLDEMPDHDHCPRGEGMGPAFKPLQDAFVAPQILIIWVYKAPCLLAWAVHRWSAAEPRRPWNYNHK